MKVLIQIYIFTGRQICFLKVSSFKQQEVLNLLNFQIHQRRPKTSSMQHHAQMVNLHVRSLKLWCGGVRQFWISGCLQNIMVKFATSSMSQAMSKTMEFHKSTPQC